MPEPRIAHARLQYPHPLKSICWTVYMQNGLSSQHWQKAYHGGWHKMTETQPTTSRALARAPGHLEQGTVCVGAASPWHGAATILTAQATRGLGWATRSPRRQNVAFCGRFEKIARRTRHFGPPFLPKCRTLRATSRMPQHRVSSPFSQRIAQGGRDFGHRIRCTVSIKIGYAPAASAAGGSIVSRSVSGQEIPRGT